VLFLICKKDCCYSEQIYGSHTTITETLQGIHSYAKKHYEVGGLNKTRTTRH